VLVTLRLHDNLPSLRSAVIVREWEPSLTAVAERDPAFRVVHWAFQDDRAHLIVEAHGTEALSDGMRSIAARFGRAVNRVWRRSGPALDGRYMHRVLRTPADVREALDLVLPEARSGVVSLPRTRLLQAGWRQLGLGAPGEPPETAR
jgi:hypothetical protein